MNEFFKQLGLSEFQLKLALLVFFTTNIDEI